MPTSTDSPAILRTPFHGYHVEHGGKLIDFAGWQMPLHYGSIIDEHRQVRSSGGLFDVSHMGRFRFKGRDAQRFLDRVCTRQVYGMQDGQVRYALVCNEQGGCRDDVLVYRLGESEYLMVCNASNRAKLLDHFGAVRGEMVFDLRDETTSTAMVAIQGPRVMDLLASVSSEVPQLKRYRCISKQVLIVKFLISRTGYTGEDGVEVILPAKAASQVTSMLLGKAGAEAADVVRPAGLGARDSLRLEAGMALYGHEIDETIDPLSAGLDFAVKLDKGDADPQAGRFIGQDALQRIATDGPEQKLVGLQLDGRRAARQGAEVVINGERAGRVTSGTLSPTLDRSIAMAYVPAAHSDDGTAVQIDLGRAQVDATIVRLPFYKRS